MLGLLIAQDNIDEIIHIIRAAKNPDLAKQAMMERFSLSDAQASAIIEMRLRALTGLEHDKLVAERNELEAQIAYFNDVLGSRELQMKIVKDELLEVKAKYGDERRSEIVYASEEFNPEDFYADDEMVITISHLAISNDAAGRIPYPEPGRVGAKGSATRDEDFIEHIYMATMHNTMLFFTEKGRCYWLKVTRFPKGRAPRKDGRSERHPDRAGRQGACLYQREASGRCGIREQQLYHHVYQGRHDQEDQTGSVLASPSERRQCHRDPRGRPVDRGQTHQRQRRGNDRGPGRQGDPLQRDTVRPIGRVGAGGAR